METYVVHSNRMHEWLLGITNGGTSAMSHDVSEDMHPAHVVMVSTTNSQANMVPTPIVVLRSPIVQIMLGT